VTSLNDSLDRKSIISQFSKSVISSNDIRKEQRTLSKDNLVERLASPTKDATHNKLFTKRQYTQKNTISKITKFTFSTNDEDSGFTI